MKGSLIWITSGVVFAAWLAPSSYADVIEWDAALGDWFEASNWDPAQVPEKAGGGGNADTASINNGGTAQADSTTVTGPVIARDIAVGAQTAGAPKSGAISGALESQGVAVEADVVF